MYSGVSSSVSVCTCMPDPCQGMFIVPFSGVFYGCDDCALTCRLVDRVVRTGRGDDHDDLLCLFSDVLSL